MDLNLDEMASKLKYSLDSVLSGSSSLNMSGTSNSPVPPSLSEKITRMKGKISRETLLTLSTVCVDRASHGQVLVYIYGTGTHPSPILYPAVRDACKAEGRNDSERTKRRARVSSVIGCGTQMLSKCPYRLQIALGIRPYVYL